MTEDRGVVVVAMSGGVDSSVAAALLVEQGYHVIGMMLRLWSETGRQGENRCCSPDAMAQARRVAAMLSIPFYVVDAQQVFYDIVVQHFINGYTQGNTPNPCVECNRRIRFDFLLKHALTLGADYLATGHYARLGQDTSGHYQVKRALYNQKDQSYVLHALKQEQLAQTLFPLGELTKPQVRQLAQQFGLPVAERPESQDLCFLGEDGYRQFLLRNAPQALNPGPILNLDGKTLGEHQGLAFYTIGQRKGLGLSSPDPLYVIKKDLQKNALIVGRKDELGKDEFFALDPNWIAGEPPGRQFRTQVKIRYKSADFPAEVKLLEPNKVQVTLDQPVRDITPGQAAVFYDDQVCLGGGVIV
jgi:tRNA-specific 2-thiouridylase